MFAVMIPVDACAEKIREAVATGGRFWDACGRRFPPVCRPQRGNPREFVVPAQVEGPELESMDAHR